MRMGMFRSRSIILMKQLCSRKWCQQEHISCWKIWMAWISIWNDFWRRILFSSNFISITLSIFPLVSVVMTSLTDMWCSITSSSKLSFNTSWSLYAIWLIYRPLSWLIISSFTTFSYGILNPASWKSCKFCYLFFWRLCGCWYTLQFIYCLIAN